MSKLSAQDENKLIDFLKDWLKGHLHSQKDLAYELNLSSGRTKEISKKMIELHKQGGIYNIAKNLIQIEQNWLKNDNLSNEQDIDLKSYNQLDIDLRVNIDALMDQMNKDHNINN